MGTTGLQTGKLALPSIQRRVDSAFERMLRSVILQLKSQWSIHAACEDRLLLRMCDGKPQIWHAPAAKKNDKQVIENIKNVTRCRHSRMENSKETRLG